jgi:hypothetical protein
MSENLEQRVEELERLAVENNKTLTCVFCGKHYPAGTPTWGAQILVDHVRNCEAHPLRSVIKERDVLLDRIKIAVEAIGESRFSQAKDVLESALGYSKQLRDYEQTVIPGQAFGVPRR